MASHAHPLLYGISFYYCTSTAPTPLVTLPSSLATVEFLSHSITRWALNLYVSPRIALRIEDLWI